MTKRSLVALFLTSFFIHSYQLAYAQDIVVKERQLTHNDYENRYASFSPDGNQILFESNREGNWNIYTMTANGENQQRLTFSDSNDRRPCWHPTGRFVLFESNRSGRVELYRLTTKNRKLKQLTKLNIGEPNFAQFSPNGKLIAYTHKLSKDEMKICIINKRGRWNKQVTKNGLRCVYPRWAPNGKELLYFSRKDTENQADEIYRLNIKTGREVRLTNWPKHNFCPSWSHDGKRIAYVTSMEDLRPEIYMMNTDGAKKQRITFNENGDTLPNWSPNDTKLLITGYRSGYYQICELTLGLK